MEQGGDPIASSLKRTQPRSYGSETVRVARRRARKPASGLFAGDRHHRALEAARCRYCGAASSSMERFSGWRGSSHAHALNAEVLALSGENELTYHPFMTGCRKPCHPTKRAHGGSAVRGRSGGADGDLTPRSWSKCRAFRERASFSEGAVIPWLPSAYCDVPMLAYSAGEPSGSGSRTFMIWSTSPRTRTRCT